MARPQRKDTHLFFECETPKELLEQVFGIISTRSNNARTDRYIFRGVGSAEKHSLVPSALRKENLPRLLAQRNLDAPEADWGAEMLDDSNQSYLEIASLSLFYRYANQQALPLPAIPQEWHSAFVRTFDEAMDAPRCEDLDIDNWPPRSLWPLIGLAQHHGVFTRLLDWSRDPYVAAYFAASAALRNLDKTKDDQKLAVWCADAALIDRFEHFNPKRMGHLPNPGCQLYIADVPYSGNHNLAAQRGRFTITLVDKVHQSLKIDSPVDEVCTHLRSHAFGTSITHRMGGREWQPFTKVTLPVRHCGELMEALHNLGYDASSIYPGFRGCADAVREAVAAKAARLTNSREQGPSVGR